MRVKSGRAAVAVRTGLALVLGFCAPLAVPDALWAQATAPGAAAAPRQLGTVKAIDGMTLTLQTAAGATVTVTLSAGAPVLQLPPGSTDLKTATPAAARDIAIGDRVLVTGRAGDSATALSAARVVLMKSNDIAARKAAQQADWQRNGTGGLVRAVDGSTLTVAAGARTLKVQTSSATVFRRYADDSVSFEDAKPGTLDQIRAGDQISVRGPKSEDGLSVAAAEVVTGTFENLSGQISSVDAAGSTVTLKDLISKKPVTVHVTSNSDLRRLPPQAAQMFASRSGGAGGQGAGGEAGAGTVRAGAAGAGAPGAGGASRRAGMDLSRMLSRLPTETLADMKPGDAVMIVASQGGPASSLTAITVLSGVESLLSATSAGAQPITLSPWTLGVPEGGGGAP